VNKTQKARTNKLINFLTKLPRKRFDFSTVCEVHNGASVPSPHTCGTYACAYGYLPAVFPRSFGYSSRRGTDIDGVKYFGVVSKDGQGRPDKLPSFFGIDCINSIFGFNDSDSDFIPAQYPRDKYDRHKVNVEAVTPKMVAKALKQAMAECVK